MASSQTAGSPPAAPAAPCGERSVGHARPRRAGCRQPCRATRRSAQIERVKIDTPSLKGSINLTGGRIDDLLLADYHETVEPTSPLVELFSPAGSEHPYYADFGWVARPGGPAVPTAETQWTAEGGPLAPGKDVTLTWDNGAGLVFRRTFSVDEKYMFTVRQTRGEPDRRAGRRSSPTGSSAAPGLPQTAGYYILHEGLIGYLRRGGPAGGRLRRPRRHAVDHAGEGADAAGSASPTSTGRAALIPPAASRSSRASSRVPPAREPTYQADFLGDAVSVPAGGAAEHQTLLFAGAKETARLDGYTGELGRSRTSSC